MADLGFEASSIVMIGLAGDLFISLRKQMAPVVRTGAVLYLFSIVSSFS